MVTRTCRIYTRKYIEKYFLLNNVKNQYTEYIYTRSNIYNNNNKNMATNNKNIEIRTHLKNVFISKKKKTRTNKIENEQAKKGQGIVQRPTSSKSMVSLSFSSRRMLTLRYGSLVTPTASRSSVEHLNTTKLGYKNISP